MSTTPAATVRRFSSILLVDGAGRLLLQERDSGPEIDPDCWGFVGGGVEPGEEFEAAAYRELAEETGLRLDCGLRLFDIRRLFHEPTGIEHEVALWMGRTDVTDADIEVGEGRRIVFVDPAQAREFDRTVAAERWLCDMLDSDLYAELIR